MNKNTFLNWVSKNLIHEAHKGDKLFYNLSIPYADSKTGYASLSLSKGQVLDATKRNGEVNPAFASVLLGAPEKTRKLSVCTKITKTGKKTYGEVELTNQEIADIYEESRKAYKAQTADAQEAVAEPAPAMAE